MSVQSRPTGSQPYQLPERATVNKGGAVIVWLFGAWATGAFLGQLGVAEPVNFFIGAGIQFLLTKAEAPIWQGDRNLIRIVALIFDSMLNAAGVWPYMRNLGSTSFWVMVSEWIGSSGEPNMITRAIVVLVVGLLTAIGPEVLWEQED